MTHSLRPRFASAALIAALLALADARTGAQSASQGTWSAPFAMPLVAVHSALMHTGQVLMFDAWEIPGTPSARLWDPATNTYVAVPNGFAELFCSGHVLAADGRLVTTGGHNGAGVGTTDATAFDPRTRTWTALPNLAYARWYPAMTELPDGRLLTMGGAISRPDIADVPEVYAGGGSWVSLLGARKDVGEYPALFPAPSGRVFVGGLDQAWLLDVATQVWTPLGPSPAGAGASVMYRPGKVMMTGGGSNGGDPVTPRTGVIDLEAAQPAWRTTSPMAYARSQHNLVVLPDGRVLVVGGADEVSLISTRGVLPVELWDPATETWTTLAAMARPRMYHSTALLLPDGRVLSAGGGRLAPAVDYLDGELFSPPYLFKGARPVITAAPDAVDYGSTFSLETPQPSSIARVTMVRTSSVTHGANYDQRFLELTFEDIGTALAVQAPAGSGIAPPGYYLLFALDGDGVPSVGRMVRVGGSEAGPSLSIGDVSVVEGTGGATTAVFPVTLSGTPGGTVTVDWATEDGTATAGLDYTAGAGTLTFPAGVTTRTIGVPVTSDALVEPNETFRVRLGNAANAAISRARGTATIVNDDAVVLPTLSIGAAHVPEGTGGTSVAAFTVTLSAAAALDVLVKYRTVPGSATSPADYASTSGTLTFAGGTTVQTIQVPVATDGQPEPDETFTVELYDPVNATIAQGLGVGTIADDDSGTLTATLAVAAGEDDATEDGAAFDLSSTKGWLGSGGSATTSFAGLRFTGVGIPRGAAIVSARLSVEAAATQWVPVAFEYAAEASAQGASFASSRPSQRTLLPPRVTHNSDEAWQSGTRYTLDDIAPVIQAVVGQADWTPGNPLTLVLRGTSAAWTRKFIAAFEAGAAHAPRLVVTYAAGEASNRPPVIGSASASPAHGTAPLPVAFAVTAADPDGQPLTFTWHFGDGASATGAAAQHTYATPGAYVATVIVSDGALETSAGVAVEVAAPPPPPPPAPRPTVSIADLRIVEGDSGAAGASVLVTLSGAPGETPVVVPYWTADGTATAPGDYVPTSGTLTFSGATIAQAIVVPVIGDRSGEPDETIAVVLGAPTGASLARGAATITIENDDLTAPFGLQARVDGSSVRFTWQPPSGGAPAGYFLDAGYGPGAMDIGTVPLGMATAWGVDGVAPGLYFVRVRAVDAAGSSATSNEVVVAVGDRLPPGPPSSLAARVSGLTVTLTWASPTVGGAPAAYVIEVGSASGGSDLLAADTGTTFTAAVAAGVPPATYYVRIRARNASGLGAASNEIAVTVQ